LRFKHSISHVKKERSNRKDVYRRTDRYAISDQYTNNGESEKKEKIRILTVIMLAHRPNHISAQDVHTHHILQFLKFFST
jgi:hypothetical protein